MSPAVRCLVLAATLAALGKGNAQGTDQDEPFVDTSGDCFKKVATLFDPAVGPYRVPREEDISERWAFVREEYGVEATCIRSDLNADGHADYASVLIRNDERGFAVAVFTAQSGGSYSQELVLEDPGSSQSVRETQLDLLKAGLHQGVFGCSPWEEKRQTLDLPVPAIQLWVGTPCSASRPLHWLFHWRAGVGYERRPLFAGEARQQPEPGEKESESCSDQCASCNDPHWEVERSAVASSDHPLAGFWKHSNCTSGPFGLAIGPMGKGKYYVSFCGPGGCFAKGGYRPMTSLQGDPQYRVIDDNAIEIVDRGGERWVRCPARE